MSATGKPSRSRGRRGSGRIAGELELGDRDSVGGEHPLRLRLAEPGPGAARGRGRRPQPRSRAAATGRRAPVAERGGAADRRRQARDGGDPARGELGDLVLADQVGQGRGEQGRRRGPLGAVGETAAGLAPAGLDLRRELLRGVVEDQQLVDRGVGADRLDDRARAARARPRSSRCSRAGWRSSPPPAAARARRSAVGSESAGSSIPSSLGPVGRDAGVAARAGEDREPASRGAGAPPSAAVAAAAAPAARRAPGPARAARAGRRPSGRRPPRSAPGRPAGRRPASRCGRRPRRRPPRRSRP